MAQETVDLIVLGGGPAGVTAALRAAELGASVALVERGQLGGTCTNDGCVPTRVLAKAARLRRDAEQFDAYGLLGEPPEVDFPRLLERTQEIVYRIHEKKQLQQHLESSGVRLFAGAGAARFADEHTIELADGTRLHGDKIILCVGGHARRLPVPGAEHALTHSDVWRLKRMPRSVAIIGAAATGCQMATVFNTFGAEVWLLDLAPRILAGEDEAVSETMSEAFRQRGVQVLSGIGGVERIEVQGEAQVLHYKEASGAVQALDVEAVILAVGWAGNVEGLNLEAAGVHSERSYIPVNKTMQTNVPHIFAAGDITGEVMLVQAGQYEARIAAENAILGPTQRRDHQIVPHGGFTDPEYASVGLTEAKAREAEACVVATVPFATVDRAVIDGHPEGFCKLIVSEETHKILGAHVVGEQALELVHVLAAGMAAGMWIEQLAELELAYPTYAAIIGLAARQIVRDLGVTPLAPEGRSLGKRAAEWERGEETEGTL